jgi:hypothetical protein
VNGRARQGCQRLDRSRRRGKKTPTLVKEGREAVCTRSRTGRVPPKAFLDAVKRPVPRSCRTEPKTPWGVPVAKAARASRERTRCGYTFVSFGWQNSVGRIARLSRREAARSRGARRALARKKFVAPSDAGRGWTEGETVRVCRRQLFVFPVRGLRVMSLQVLDTKEGVLGPMPVLLSPASRSRGPLTRRSNSASPSARSVMTDSTSGGTDSDSGVPAGDDGNVRGRHDAVKALQGPRRTAGSPHPRR